MDDVGFSSLLESAIGYIDERWGRPAAWACATALAALCTGAAAYVALH